MFPEVDYNLLEPIEVVTKIDHLVNMLCCVRLVISANIVLFHFLHNSRNSLSFQHLSVNSNLIPFELQELLDLKTRRRAGPELVQEIRKQANDVKT